MTKENISVNKVITVSLFVNLLDAVLNLGIAIITGSAVMLAEFFHGFADVVSAGFLFIGVKRSGRPKDRDFSFGYGKEIYFWTLLSSLLMFTVTAGLSVYFGFKKFLAPEAINHIWLAFLVLSISLVSNVYSLSLSFRRIAKGRGKNSFINHFMHSPKVATKNAFIVDLMGTTTVVVGLLSLILYQLTGQTRLDGLGAMLVGVVIAFFAFLLILTVRDLIVGRGAPDEIVKQIRQTVAKTKEVNSILDLRTMQIGVERYLLNLEINFKDHLSTDEIEKVIDKIKSDIRREIPSVYHIQIEPETS